MAQKTASTRDEHDRDKYHKIILENLSTDYTGGPLLKFANGKYIQDEANGNITIKCKSLDGDSLAMLDKHFKINWIAAEIDDKTPVVFLALGAKTSLKDRAKKRME